MLSLHDAAPSRSGHSRAAAGPVFFLLFFSLFADAVVVLLDDGEAEVDDGVESLLGLLLSHRSLGTVQPEMKEDPNC